MSTYHLSAFADEITPKFELQLQSLVRLGIDHISLRQINETSIFDLGLDDVKNHLLPLLNKYNIKVSSIGSPIGKVDIHNHVAVQHQFDKMKNLIAICQLLNVKFIRIFSYYNTTKKDEDLVLNHIRTLLTFVEGTSIVLVHENEKDIYGDTPEKCLRLYQMIQHPQFKAVFDPANFVQVNADPLHAYQLLEPHIRYLHLKDAQRMDGENVLLGTGDGHIKEIVEQAIYNPNISFVTFEPHLVDFEGLWQLEQGREVPPQSLPSYEESFQRFQDSITAFHHLISDRN